MTTSRSLSHAVNPKTSNDVGRCLVSDAHLAALAIGYGAELCSTDNDFAMFPGLRWRNPLLALAAIPERSL